MNTINFSELENKIGYTFKEKFFLERALTHSSYNKEKKTKHQDNERLEFLGDAFLDAIISAEIFGKLKGGTEGRLTKTRALIVCESSLVRVANNYDLGKYMYMGHGEETAGGRHKDSILADAMEAIIGALYLDAGYEATKEFVVNSFKEIIKEAVDGKLFSDYKSEVQEVLQKKDKHSVISYEIEREEGPAHNKTFFVNLICNGKIMGNGTGKSKKEAEQKAAKATLEKL